MKLHPVHYLQLVFAVIGGIISYQQIGLVTPGAVIGAIIPLFYFVYQLSIL